ncbi:MAG: tRNA (N(6)-L-threonylcarbamoyladenosine(37)-C(2))-methylthiotransferase MtaB [Bacilli bacterium]|nr:tRNA (N(6)-L-threonylcarbamoyladenosine(37)-C(2))-methylthiotransferase MtaB [Bacilli bacterium]MDD4283032.1 tRNA (N(6)-L-threonylcarbamoyladenosine(37)-C(2))-methylthiotransferase MtaB [Bacilli bacterium]MDD4718592.1 tRNA (N(6)-L-threonylcarbamoyladenosine(37)-C(2))-methylthiotransferase MtaB [Bacilli bacterium]
MKFAIETLGCKVNTYETNVMIDSLENIGYNQVNFNDLSDIYIINTCTVTNNADSKSMKMIRQAIKHNPDAIIVVVGCLVQTNYDLVDTIDGVDIILGNVHKSKIGEYIQTFLKTRESIKKIEDICNVEFEEMQLNNFNKTRAFVKIQDGCNNYCSYCIIPFARGNVRSKKPEVVTNEIKELIKNGHQEIVLTGIHTGSYGVDLDNYSLSKLLTEIVKIDNLLRLRISSIEITELSDEFMNILKNNEVLVDHMHIPLQSGSNKILKLMNRKYGIKYFVDKIDKLHSIRPNMLITTDVIVGFPNETEELFKETIDTIKTINFAKIHVFPYSKREGTAAAKMNNHVDPVTKKKRTRELLKLSKKLEVETMNKYLNKTLEFIPEIYKDGYLIGHAGNYLSIKSEGPKELLNKQVKVLIKEIKYPHLVGVLIDINA